MDLLARLEVISRYYKTRKYDAKSINFGTVTLLLNIYNIFSINIKFYSKKVIRLKQVASEKI